MTVNLDSLGQAKGTLIDLAIRFGPRLLSAGIILVAGFMVGRWVAGTVSRSLHKFDLEPPVRQLMTRLARVLVLGLFVIMALQNLGIELLPLIAGLGVAGAGIALATQGVLGNVIAGLTIIFTKPYRVGEYIAIVGVEGTVDTISLFSTVLTHTDRSRIIVPNRKVVGEILHNYGRIRQATLQVGVSYDTDLPMALATIRDLVQAHPRVLADPAPVIQVTRLADSAVTIEIRPWVSVNDFVAVPGDLNVSVVDGLRRRGIVIPYPQREVRLLGKDS